MTRPRSAALGPLIGVPLDVLDNGTGYIRVVDYMGNDASVARAARVSYARQDADRGPEADGKLIRYLMRHRHTSPFEMARIVLHVRLPIFVARQWMRHRTWSFNEVSARYTTLPDDVYVPDLADICGPPTDNKQGRGRRCRLAKRRKLRGDGHGCRCCDRRRGAADRRRPAGGRRRQPLRLPSARRRP
jgi:thymidylate synthase (FAD)